METDLMVPFSIYSAHKNTLTNRIFWTTEKPNSMATGFLSS